MARIRDSIHCRATTPDGILTTKGQMMMRPIELYGRTLYRSNLRGDVCGRCSMNMLSASHLVTIRVEVPDGHEPPPVTRFDIPAGADQVVTLCLLFDELCRKYESAVVWIQMNGIRIDDPYARDHHRRVAGLCAPHLGHDRTMADGSGRPMEVKARSRPATSSTTPGRSPDVRCRRPWSWSLRRCPARPGRWSIGSRAGRWAARAGRYHPVMETT